MLEKLARLATGGRVLVSLAALISGGAALFSFGPYASLLQLNEGFALPEEQLSSPEFTAAFLDRIGPQGRELYATFQLLDVMNPLLICTFLVLLIAWLLKHSSYSGYSRLLTLIPLLVLLAELWENSLLYLATAGFPSPLAGIETLQIATSLKFGGLGLSALVALGLAGLALLRKIRDDAQ